MRAVTVHLVRHGQSTWNVEGRLQGQTAHPPLTDQGRRDAARAADALRAQLGNATPLLVTSDLTRARETADVIAGRLGVAAVATEALREQHLGSMQGKLSSELQPEPVPDGVDITEVRWAGGESVADVHARLSAYFAELLPTAPAHVVAVTHGDTLRVAVAVLTGQSHREVVWDPVPNGSIVSLRIRA